MTGNLRVGSEGHPSQTEIRGGGPKPFGIPRFQGAAATPDRISTTFQPAGPFVKADLNQVKKQVMDVANRFLPSQLFVGGKPSPLIYTLNDEKFAKGLEKLSKRTNTGLDAHSSSAEVAEVIIDHQRRSMGIALGLGEKATWEQIKTKGEDFATFKGLGSILGTVASLVGRGLLYRATHIGSLFSSNSTLPIDFGITLKKTD